MDCLGLDRGDDGGWNISSMALHLSEWRTEWIPRGPRFVKVGALVRYRPEDLEQWMESLPAGGTASQQQEIHLRLASG
jgi:hypothetical protein